MGIVSDKIGDLRNRKEQLMQMGGEKSIDRQHDLGKMTARERLGRNAGQEVYQNHRFDSLPPC